MFMVAEDRVAGRDLRKLRKKPQRRLPLFFFVFFTRLGEHVARQDDQFGRERPHGLFDALFVAPPVQVGKLHDGKIPPHVLAFDRQAFRLERRVVQEEKDQSRGEQSAQRGKKINHAHASFF